MIFALAALGAPVTVVSFDNGGFNLPLFTERDNGVYAQPSVAQQITADIARLQGASPRVFTYLPPGRRAGQSSEPFEVVPAKARCGSIEVRPEPDGACWCPPGEPCWQGLDVNRHPAASTSLFQAVQGVRRTVGPGPRVEVHFTDLFEEDPASVANPADADKCVTAAGTRKALEAVLRTEGALDHLAVGRLKVKVSEPRSPSGGLVAFREGSNGCWSAQRLRSWGGGPGAEIEMGVLVLGVGTALSDQEVRRFVVDLSRQISAPMELELVMVREPPTQGAVRGGAVPATDARIPLGGAPERATPCDAVEVGVTLQSGADAVEAVAAPRCDALGELVVRPAAISRAFNHHAGLNPFVSTVPISGRVHVRGDGVAIQEAVSALGVSSAERPLVFWDAVQQALRFDRPDGAWRPIEHVVHVENVTITGADDRPWFVSLAVWVLVALGVGSIAYALQSRWSANRAFEETLGSAEAQARPLAAVLAEAQERARSGRGARVAVALVGGGALGTLAALGVLVLHGIRVG